MAATAFWDDRPLEAVGSTRRLQLGGHSVLFCARSQRLYELNETADAIWRAVAAEKTPRAAAAALDESPEMLDFVRQAVDAWMRNGQLAPRDVITSARSEASEEIGLILDELEIGVRTSESALLDVIVRVFGQFASAKPVERWITIVPLGDLFFMLDGEQPLGAWDERRWIPELKARLTELYTKAAGAGFLAHAALVARAGLGILLCAEPGGGKTTLSLALGGSGFQHHADDIVRISDHAMASGLPFSPAAKSGSWPLLGQYVPAIGRLPIYLRSDGQEVKYVPLAHAGSGLIQIGGVLLLQRRAGGGVRLDRIEPLEALTAILGSAYSVRNEISADALSALADALGAAHCARLTYSDLDEAVAAVEAFSQ